VDCDPATTRGLLSKMHAYFLRTVGQAPTYIYQYGGSERFAQLCQSCAHARVRTSGRRPTAKLRTDDICASALM
jgi:hypothetical protein